MPTEIKRQEIDSLVEKVRASQAIYIVEYRGLTISKSTAVRRSVKASDRVMKVTKNTFMRIALAWIDFLMWKETAMERDKRVILWTELDNPG